MKETKQTKSKVISSLFWKLMERGGTQGVQFVVQILLARLLEPKEFGTIAIVLVFINLAQVFVQSGLNTALIQKREADETDFSSVFYLSLFIAFILYIIIYFSSPYIANFYGDPVLVQVLRVLSLTLFFGAINSIQNAYVSRHMMFKKLFYSSIGANVLSGIGGIVAAYAGLGVWALVIQQLLSQLSTTVIMWFTVKWRPHLVFSLERVKTLFSFGWKLLVSSLLNTLYMDIRTLIIGKIYEPKVLGYYNRGEQIPKVLVNNLNGSIQSVMLPTLSSVQDNKKEVKRIVRRSIKTSSFLVFPMMAGLAAVAEPIVKIMLTDKWLPAVPFLQVFCIVYAMMPIHTANLQAINAIGRSDIFLKVEIIKKITGLIILAISLPYGVYAIAIGQILSGIISSIINAYPNKNLLNYSFIEQLKDLMPSLLLSIFMGTVVLLLSYLNLSVWLQLMLQIVLGVVIYFTLSKLLKMESFEYIRQTLIEIVGKRRDKNIEK